MHGQIFMNHWRVPHQKFRPVRRKILTKSWYLFIQKFFKTRTFPKHKVPLRIFSVLWDKRDRKNRDILLREKFLLPEPFCNTGGWAHDVFRQFVTKKLRRKNKTPPSYPLTISVLELFWKTKAFPREVFQYWENKRFPRKIEKLPDYA